MIAEQKELKKQKRVRHSIRSKIIATAVCPLIAMSTIVSMSYLCCTSDKRNEQN